MMRIVMLIRKHTQHLNMVRTVQVGAKLDQRYIPQARLVCSAWASGIALGITHLRPRLTGASGMLIPCAMCLTPACCNARLICCQHNHVLEAFAGLAWHNMRDRVNAIFPSITDLDLRQHNVMVSRLQLHVARRQRGFCQHKNVTPHAKRSFWLWVHSTAAHS